MCSPTKGDKIRSSCLTLALSGAQKRAEMLCHPCLLGRPQVGRNAMSPLHSRGSPKQRGTKSEAAPSHLPSRGHTSGQKCYVTPAFSGIPKTKEDKIRNGYHTPAFSGAPKKAKMLRHHYILEGP